MRSSVRFSAIAVVAAAVLLFAGCVRELPEYRYSWNELTDGRTVYKPLPEGWEYAGEFSVLAGTVEEGNALYASEDGLFVREKKNILQDMEYAPFVRSDVELPEISQETCSVTVFPNEGEPHTLSDTAKAEFFGLMGGLSDGDETQGEGSAAEVFITVPGIGGLRASGGFSVERRENGYYLVGSDGSARIPEGSALLAETIGEE